ncbi:hypothetical protein ABEB36_014034 [Hypothenemus hampei]|uniref:Uncharacterized protein n=1 Tax=Hypothenemus hampei TaxID=57062 RepID=A0ABD1E3A5_HYPHA
MRLITEENVQVIFISILKKYPFIKKNVLETKFIENFGGVGPYYTFCNLGFGSIEYVLLRTPFVYEDEREQYYICARHIMMPGRKIN